MDRNNRERGRSQPTPQRQRIYSGKTHQDFERLRGEKEQQFVPSSKQPIFNFHQHLNIKETRSQKIQLESSQQKPIEPQHNISEKEKNYRHALNYLKKTIRLDQKHEIIKNAYKVMLESLQVFRRQEISKIESAKERLLTQEQQQRKKRKRQLHQGYEEAKKKRDQALSQYQEANRNYRAAKDSNSPQQYSLKEKKKQLLEKYQDQKRNVDLLYDELKQVNQQTEREKLQIERKFAQKLNEKQRMFEKQREIHANYKMLIKKSSREKVSQSQKLKDKQLQQYLVMFGEAPKDILKLVKEQKQPTCQEEELWQRVSELRDDIMQERTSATLALNRCQELRKDYQALRRNLLDTINTKEKLITAKEDLQKASQKYTSVEQQYQNAIKRSDPKLKILEDKLDFFKKQYDRHYLSVKELNDRLETLDQAAGRNRRHNLDQLQSMLRQLEKFQDLLDKTEKKARQREERMQSLKGLQRRKREMEQKRENLKQKMHMHQKDATKKKMDQWMNELRGLENELRNLDEKLTEISYNKEEP